MNRPLMLFFALPGCIGIFLTAAACAPTPDVAQASEERVLQLAQHFRHHVESGDMAAADAMLAERPRRWFERRRGAGSPWNIGDGATGPWADWDRHMRSRKVVVDWRADGLQAVVTIRETNDYFELLERGWVTNEVVYLFNSDFKIYGHVIRGTGERPLGRTDDFLRWAREHEPEELEYLMPAGEIDPTADRPPRMRRLLEKWRRSEDQP